MVLSHCLLHISRPYYAPFRLPLTRTSCAVLQVAYDDDGGVGLGSRITLSAVSGTEYFVVLEPFDSYSCGNASIVLNDAVVASPPPSPAISGRFSFSCPMAVFRSLASIVAAE